MRSSCWIPTARYSPGTPARSVSRDTGPTKSSASTFRGSIHPKPSRKDCLSTNSTSRARRARSRKGWRVRKDGSQFWASVVITAIRGSGGRLLGFAEVTCDLTQRRGHDEALRRSEERFRLLIEGVSDYAIFMLDANGIVVTWNVGVQRIKGYSADEIIGRHF